MSKRLDARGQWTWEAVIGALEGREVIWSIGQLSPTSIRRLDRMAAEGKVQKARLLWPYITFGTCAKTCYYLI